MTTWRHQDLPLVKKVTAQIDSGYLSFRQAAKKYNVTKYQVEKWVAYVRNQVPGSSEAVGRKKIVMPKAKANYDYSPVIDPALKKQLIEDIYCGKMTRRNASQKYKVPSDVIGVWLNKLPGYRSSVSGYKTKIDEQVKMHVVRQIQADKLSQVRAALQYQVSRSVINRWIDNYSIFNLDGSICYQTIGTMTPDEQNKELLDQLSKLKAQLEHEKMKNEALQTLLQVAEEKFGIQIKKKRGPKQSKK